MSKRHDFGYKNPTFKRIDDYLAKGDKEIGHGGRFAQILNSPQGTHFIREAAEMHGGDDPKISREELYFALGLVALVAIAGAGCIGHDNLGDHLTYGKAMVGPENITFYAEHTYPQFYHLSDLPKKDYRIDGSREYSFSTSDGKEHKITVPLSSNLTESVKNYQIIQESTGDYSRKMISDPRDDAIIDDIVRQIDKISPDSEAGRVDAAIRFVQDVHYGYIDFPNELKTPYEILESGKGICGGKSGLLGEILRHMGYGAVLVNYYYGDGGHGIVGIKCPPGKGNVGPNKEYACIDSVDRLGIGEIRSDLQSKTPELTVISEGKTISDEDWEDLKKLEPSVMGYHTSGTAGIWTVVASV